MTGDWRVVPLDFGLTAAIRDGAHLDTPGVIEGTLLYLAPELAN